MFPSPSILLLFSFFSIVLNRVEVENVKQRPGLDGVGAYIDDVIIYSNAQEEHLRLIRSFFDRLSEFQQTVNLNESEFCHGSLTV